MKRRARGHARRIPIAHGEPVGEQDDDPAVRTGFLNFWSAEGKFRLDLYYRLGIFTIHLPLLRERGSAPDTRDLYAEVHRELDRLVLPRVLEYTGGNQNRAALLLGIARQTLRAKLQDLALHVAHAVEADRGCLP